MVEIEKGIGTLRERTLHATLKSYYEPNEALHEQKYGGYIADIKNEKGIIEIQTGSCYPLRKKLEDYLAPNDIDVQLVLPVVQNKWLSWIDPETGEVTARRRSPKCGTPSDCLWELPYLRPFLTYPQFHLCILMVDVEEYRNLDGWSRDRKHGSTRYERIPLSIGEEIHIENATDCLQLLPPLPKTFTAKVFAKAAKLSPRKAQRAIWILREMCLIEKIGTEKKAYIYRISDDVPKYHDTCEKMTSEKSTLQNG